jgi:lipopolysaccharide/colanic/teichoic acid biosynthesis glycosyltransferase
MPAVLQRVLALIGIIGTAPLNAALGVAIRLDTPGPVLFRSIRVGRGGRPFVCLKLRTMRADSAGSAITGRGDARVTRVGQILRRSRLDELPQLWNVARGEMLLVGPRPEDPRFVDLTDPLHHEVFTAMPGITGAAQLAYLDEAEMLGSDDPEGRYLQTVLPQKLEIDAAYLRHRSFRLDVWIIAQTILAALGRPPSREAIKARL